MKLGGQMDQRGSRACAPDPRSATAESWVARLAGPLTAWAKLLFEMLLRPGARDAAETVLLARGNETRFSVAGAERDTKRRRGTQLPWPEGEAKLRRPTRYRRDGE